MRIRLCLCAKVCAKGILTGRQERNGTGKRLSLLSRSLAQENSAEDQDGGSDGGAVLFVGEILATVKLALMTSRYALVH
jgi:hypothetical protein